MLNLKRVELAAVWLALKFIWDLSGGTGKISYILGLGVLVLIVFHVTYGIFVAVEMLKKHVLRRHADRQR